MRPSDISVKFTGDDDIRLLRSRIPQTLAERWGLVLMPNPDANGFHADAVWSHDVYRHQVEVNCTPRKPEQICSIWRDTLETCDVTHITDRVGREFLLLRAGGCVVQIRCTGMSLLSLEPVRMKLQISNFDGYERRLKAQKRVVGMLRADGGVRDVRWSKRTQILRNAIIALDQLEQGKSHREIAMMFFGESAVEDGWQDERSTMRGQVRYVIKKGKYLRNGGYLTELLGSDRRLERGSELNATYVSETADGVEVREA